MQAITCFHDGIPYPILQKTDFVLDGPVALHPTNGMFNPDSDRRDPTIGCFLRRREFSFRRFFLGLDDRDVLQAEVLEALILIQRAPRWQAISSQLGQALLRGFAFIGVAQEANVTGLVDHEQVIERVTLLRATVIFLLLFGIGRAVDRMFSATMPKRGMVQPPSVECVLTIAANSAAVRAGSGAWSAKA
jgi:hypothetical protein